MTFLNYINEYFETGSLGDLKNEEKFLRRAGFLGYFFGILSLFVAMRLLGSIGGGVISFFFFFSLVLLLNYAFCSVIALFMDMLGQKSSPAWLFYYFGITETVWLFALPLALISLAFNLPFGFFFFLLSGLIFLFRLKIIKTVYSSRYKLALIAFMAPYMVFNFLLFVGFFYSIYWMLSAMGL